MKAAETYLELNFIRGGGDAATQEAVFQIGASLKNEKRWVEALHVLETFVDSFPRHAQAGQALTMIGQIHQTNQAWDDAIKAYRRVIDEYKDGQWVQEAKWSIAECKINLSQWRGGDGGLPRLTWRPSRKTPSWPRPTAASTSSRTWPASRSWSTRRASGRPSTPSSRSPRSCGRNWPTRSKASSSIARW